MKSYTVLLLAFSVGCSQAQRTFSLGLNCPGGTRDALNDAREMAAAARTFKEGNGQNRIQAVLDALFPGATTVETDRIFSALQDFADATEVQTGGNVRIQCDDDQNWVIANNDQFPGVDTFAVGNKPWYDSVADVVFNLGVQGSGNTLKQEPGCRAHDDATRALTYCGLPFSSERDLGDVCRITLCNQFLPGRTDQDIKYFSFGDVRMGKDLSKRKSEVPFPKPKVDDYRMLSVTIVHEWMHTIYSEGVLQYEDQEYPNSYGWKNMVRMGRGSSLHNADSVAYVGLTARIMERGDTDTTQTKTYRFDAEDGSIHS